MGLVEDHQKTVGYIAVAAFVVYGLMYKWPIPCFACDEGGFFYRCMPGTGAGSAACSAYALAEKRFNQASGIFEDAGEVLSEIWDFTSEGLPDIITEFIGTMRDQILNLKRNIGEKINGVITFIREKVSLFVTKIKDVATDAYEKYLKKVIDSMINFLTNNILNPIYTVIDKIIEFREMVWNNLKEAMQRVTDINIMGFTTQIVDVFKKIPEAIDKLKEGLVNMINWAKNNLVGGIEAGINGGAELVEDVVGGVSNMTDRIVDGSEGIVNGSIKFINDRINNIEGTVNTVGDKIEGMINTTMKPVVNGIASGVNSISGFSLPLGIGRPFSFIGTMGQYSDIDIKDLDIPTIGDVDFPSIDFAIDIPEVDLPDIPDLKVEHLQLPSIPGFDFISEKVENIMISMQNIFDNAMDPLYTAIATVTLLIGNVRASVVTFYETYLSWDSIKLRASNIRNQVENGIETLKEFIFDDIVPAFLDILGGFKDALLDFIGTASEQAWIFLKKVGVTIRKMFSQGMKIVTKVAKMAIKAYVGYMTFVWGSIIDKTTKWIPLPLSFRVLLVLMTVVMFFAGGMITNGIMIFKLGFNAGVAGLTSLSSADKMVTDAIREKFPKMGV